ncbi:unnamed protein product [Ilex paraguariensis]|uniref:FLZ-type domain-containing protein n=1 Tax=Ilex paraguariensis TaxID=185542 RepID=A0ABC8RGM0_9AQUA
MDYTTTRRSSFLEEDDGLASIADIEAGSSGNHNHHHHHHNHFISRPIYYSQRRSSLGNLSNYSVPSPRSGRFNDTRYEEHQPYFLDACSLCKKPLGDNRDIFMYRGDTPFCSEECRQEQIEIDEAKEKSWNLSASMKALRKKDPEKSSTSPNKTTKDFPFRTSTVAAA